MRYVGNNEAPPPLPEELLTKLTGLIINCWGTVTLPSELPALTVLYLFCNNINGLRSASKLTKLTWHSKQAITVEDCFDRLVSLTISLNTDKGKWNVEMPRLKKLVIHCKEPLALDLQGAVSLEKLVYDGAEQAQIKNAPPSLKEITVVPNFYMDMLGSQEDWSKFNIRSFRLIAEEYAYTSRPDDTAQFFSHLHRCSTLRHLKLDSMPEECLVHLTGLTQLEELDLVNNSIVLADKKQISQSKMLELSTMLPTTRVKYGFDPPTSTKRDLNHWYVNTMIGRDYDPHWVCTCSTCRHEDY